MSAVDAPMGLVRVTDPAKRAQITSDYQATYGRPRPTEQEVQVRKERARKLLAKRRRKSA